MNIDHFFWIDTVDVLSSSSSSSLLTLLPSRLLSSLRTFWTSYSPFSLPLPLSLSHSRPPTLKKKDTLPLDLAQSFLSLPKLGKLDLGTFAPVVNVAPSVVTTYYPGVRVFTYNVSGLVDDGRPIVWDRRVGTGGTEIDEEEEEEDDVGYVLYDIVLLPGDLTC